MKASDAPPVSRKRGTLILLGLLFLAPVALSFYLYYGTRVGSTSGQVNRGDLIDPARPLPEVSLPTPDGKAADAKFLRGKWSLIYVGPGACDASCRKALYDMRQVRLSLNQDMDRVQRVFLYTGLCCEQPFFTDEHGGLIAVGVDTEDGRKLLERFPGHADVPAVLAGRIYLSDPLGNLLMSYPPQVEAKGMREDLKRLLKLSHIG